MKIKEIKALSTEELKKKKAASEKEYANLKMAHAITPLENPMQLRALRRTIAQFATVLTEKESQQ